MAGSAAADAKAPRAPKDHPRAAPKRADPSRRKAQLSTRTYPTHWHARPPNTWACGSQLNSSRLLPPAETRDHHRRSVARGLDLPRTSLAQNTARPLKARPNRWIREARRRRRAAPGRHSVGWRQSWRWRDTRRDRSPGIQPETSQCAGQRSGGPTSPTRRGPQPGLWRAPDRPHWRNPASRTPNPADRVLRAQTFRVGSRIPRCAPHAKRLVRIATHRAQRRYPARFLIGEMPWSQASRSGARAGVETDFVD